MLCYAAVIIVIHIDYGHESSRHPLSLSQSTQAKLLIHQSLKYAIATVV